jgi:hypothetical protein
MTGAPSGDRPLAVPPVGQVDQLEDDAQDNEQPQDKIDVGQDIFDFNAQETQPDGGKMEDQDHHQPPELRTYALQEQIIELLGGATDDRGQDAPDQPGAEQVAS